MDIVHTVPPHYYFFSSSSSLAARNYFRFPVKQSDWLTNAREWEKEKESAIKPPSALLLTFFISGEKYSLVSFSSEQRKLQSPLGRNKPCARWAISACSFLQFFLLTCVLQFLLLLPFNRLWSVDTSEKEGKKQRELSPVANLVLIYCRLKVCIKCVPPFSSLSKG